MPDIQWTDAQRAAIDDRGGSLLVSAAAGSGKTAVLTERVVSLLKDEANPIAADRLLIVTFTNAAAAELRARIAARLEQSIAEAPQNNRLRRQKMLLQRAHICTIDAFCLHLLQQHFTALDIPPDFALGDSGAISRLKAQALSQTLEEAYLDPNFCAFANLYGKSRSDGAASAAILQLYDFLRTMPDATRFTETVLAQWGAQRGVCAEAWCEEMRTEVADKCALGKHFAEQAHLYCEADYEETLAAAAEKKTQKTIDAAIAKANDKFQCALAGIEAMMDAFDAVARVTKQPYCTDLAVLEANNLAALQASPLGGWDALYDALTPYRSGAKPLPSLKGLGVRFTGENGKIAKNYADQSAELFEDMLALVPCTLAQNEEDCSDALPKITALLAAQNRFAELFYRKKIEKKMLEFSDLEHLALQLLAQEQGVATPLAQSIRGDFDAVMIDEYQDTNALQETLYRRLANVAGDNLFFVGDLKQSIYRFRQAEPDIFAQKLRSFTPLAQGKARPAPVRNRQGMDERIAGADEIGDAAQAQHTDEHASKVAEIVAVGADSIDGFASKQPDAAPQNTNALLSLDANFRSTAAVVDGVNFIFTALMSPLLGGTEYGDGQRLVCESGSAFAGSAHLLLDPDGEGDAAQVAAKIEQLVALGAAGDAAGMVRSGNALRPVRYEDCCILLSTRAPFAQYAEALAACGIATYADSAEDLLSTSHILPLVSLLQIIDNPAQDIPLAAAMLSVLFGFTEDDLVALRLACPRGSLYGAVAQVAGQARTMPQESAEPTTTPVTSVGEGFHQKVATFYETLSALRRISHTLAPEELLAEIFATTHYLALVGAMPNGQRRREDVSKFVSYVATAGANGIESLVRNMEQTQASGGLVDTAPGKVKPGCVTIMTIHRSKGLQFPVVFVANLDHRFNTDDLKRKILLHKTQGLGLQLRAGVEGGNYQTLASTALRHREKYEIYSEQMRVLYVALTRAQDHLYMTGTAKSLAKRLTALGYRQEGTMYRETYLDTCLGASCFMDWLLFALLRHPSSGNLRELQQAGGITIAQAEYPLETLLYQPPEAPEQDAESPENTKWQGLTATPDEALTAQFVAGFGWQYPHAALTALPAKVSVTSLVHKEQGTILARPAFMAKDGMTAAEKGTALHAFLENADFEALKRARAAGKGTLRAALRDEQARQEAEQRMPPEIAEKLEMPSVEAFFMGEAFRRIAHATEIHREYAFITGLPASEVLEATAAVAASSARVGAPSCERPPEDAPAPHILPEDAHAGDMSSSAALAASPADVGALPCERPLADAPPTTDPTILVQGIADLVLVYPDHLELLDYKSDHGKNENAYRAAYTKQLEYYAKAIEKRFGARKITYKALYSFDLDKLIEV